MKHDRRPHALAGFAFAAMLCATSAFAQSSGAPPGNTPPGGDTAGKGAGIAGGAGAAGQGGTDPATLSRIETQRVQKKNAQIAPKGASTPDAGKRKAWNE